MIMHCGCGASATAVGPWEAHLMRCQHLIQTLRIGASDPRTPMPSMAIVYPGLAPTALPSRRTWFAGLDVSVQELPAQATLNGGLLASSIILHRSLFVPRLVEVIARRRELDWELKGVAIRKVADAAAASALVAAMKSGDVDAAIREFVGVAL